MASNLWPGLPWRYLADCWLADKARCHQCTGEFQPESLHQLSYEVVDISPCSSTLCPWPWRMRWFPIGRFCPPSSLSQPLPLPSNSHWLSLQLPLPSYFPIHPPLTFMSGSCGVVQVLWLQCHYPSPSPMLLLKNTLQAARMPQSGLGQQVIQTVFGCSYHPRCILQWQ